MPHSLDQPSGASGRVHAETPPSPAAARLTTARLRDPRLWAGVLLVAVSAVAGGRALAKADDTTAVWAAARDLPAGTVLAPDDVVKTEVRFADASSAASYALAGDAIDGRRLIASLSPGELVSGSMVRTDARSEPELPLGVAAADLPADLGAGDRVDVWAAPLDGARGSVARVLRGVRVIAVTRPDIAASGVDRQALIAVGSADDVAAALAGLAHARPVLVRVDG